MGYWRKIVAKRARKETQYLQPWKVYSSIGSALATPIGSYMVGHLTVLSTVVSSILVALSVYTLLMVAEFVYRFFTVPAQMHKEALAENENLINLVRQLREQPLPITVAIQGVYFSTPANIHVNFRVHNNGLAPTTLYGWKLESRSEPSIATRIILPQGGEKLVKISQGDVQSESISFEVHGRPLVDIKKSEMAWCLRFSDTSNKSYAVALPEGS